MRRFLPYSKSASAGLSPTALTARHTFEFGGVVQRQSTGRLDLNTTNFSYSSLSDFLNNLPGTISITFDVPSLTLHMYQFEGYIQDSYRVPKEAHGLL